MPKKLTETQRLNRQRFPDIAALVDEARELFGDGVRVKLRIIDSASERSDMPSDTVESQTTNVQQSPVVLPKSMQSPSEDPLSLDKQRRIEALVASGEIQFKR